MDKSRRKELAREYADRKQPIGVYAVRCDASGDVWVGGTKNLDKRWNAIVFSANTGGAPEASLQAAWTKHGAESFTYEILEAFEETNEHTLKTLLPERTEFWRSKLGALPLMGV
jgi:hypothetical protein